MMLKKRSTDKAIIWGPKKIQSLRRVVECLFLFNAGPKRGRLSYLTEIRVIRNTSDVSFLIIDNRYDKHPLFWSGFRDRPFKLKIEIFSESPNQSIPYPQRAQMHYQNEDFPPKIKLHFSSNLILKFHFSNMIFVQFQVFKNSFTKSKN